MDSTPVSALACTALVLSVNPPKVPSPATAAAVPRTATVPTILPALRRRMLVVLISRVPPKLRGAAGPLRLGFDLGPRSAGPPRGNRKGSARCGGSAQFGLQQQRVQPPAVLEAHRPQPPGLH